jgi:hypothetical protein
MCDKNGGCIKSIFRILFHVNNERVELRMWNRIWIYIMHMPTPSVLNKVSQQINVWQRWESLMFCATNKSVCLSVCLWLCSPFLKPGRFFGFLIPYTVGRTPCTGDQPVARPLPAHRINAHRHPCLEWDSNPRPQRSSERREFTP